MSQHTTRIRYCGALLECCYDHDAATPGSRTEEATPERLEITRIRENGADVTNTFGGWDRQAIARLVLREHKDNAEDARTEARIRDLEVNHG